MGERTWLDIFRSESEEHKGWVFGYTLAHMIKRASDEVGLRPKSTSGNVFKQGTIENVLYSVLKELRKSWKEGEEWKKKGSGIAYSPKMQKFAAEIFVPRIKEKCVDSNDYELFKNRILEIISKESQEKSE